MVVKDRTYPAAMSASYWLTCRDEPLDGPSVSEIITEQLAYRRNAFLLVIRKVTDDLRVLLHRV